MPAIRTSRSDIIIRVPRAINLPKQSKETEEGGNGKENQQSADSILQIASPYNPEASGSTPSRRSASPVKGGRSEDHIRNVTSNSGETASSGKKKEQTDVPVSKYQYANQATSSAEWNSLLIWARRQRGPQWDSATGMWQVDQGSTEYYAFSNDPARHTKLSTNLHHHHEGEQDTTQDGNMTQDGIEQDRKSSIADIKTLPAGADNNQLSVPVELQNSNPSFHPSSTAAGAPTSIGFNEDSPPPMGPGGRRARAR